MGSKKVRKHPVVRKMNTTVVKSWTILKINWSWDYDTTILLKSHTNMDGIIVLSLHMKSVSGPKGMTSPMTLHCLHREKMWRQCEHTSNEWRKSGRAKSHPTTHFFFMGNSIFWLSAWDFGQILSNFSKMFDFSLIFCYQMKALTERSHLNIFL